MQEYILVLGFTVSRIAKSHQKATMVLLPAKEEITMETREASPAHLLLKIESFSLLSKNWIQEYELRIIEAGGHKRRLIIYPDGDEIGKKSDGISVYLSIVETESLPVDWEVNATFTVFLYNQILDNYTCFGGNVRRFHAINTKRGFSKLISKRSFADTSNGYLVGDNCVFGTEVRVIRSHRVIERVSVREVETPYKHDLVISNFSKLDPKTTWKSEEFTAGDYRWKIRLYPNGDSSVEGSYVSIFLECVDAASFAPHEKVKADFCIRIKNKDNDKHYTKNLVTGWFSSAEKNAWGYCKFITISDMREGYIVEDDSCHLETEICIKAVVRDASK